MVRIFLSTLAPGNACLTRLRLNPEKPYGRSVPVSVLLPTAFFYPVVGVTVFEIDHGLIRLLRRLFVDELADGRLTIVEGDFLKTHRELYEQQGLPNRLIGNLPYSTGSVMIGRMMEEDTLPPHAILTLQKEVALRITASPGSKEYSAFSLVCALRAEAERLGDIGGGAFFPPPQVVSTILRLRRRDTAPAGPRPGYFSLVHDLFRARRKTAANNLKGGRLAAELGWERLRQASANAGISLQRRGETFSSDEVLRLLTEIEHLTPPR